MLVFDVCDKESFDSVGSWMSEVNKYASSSVNKILIGNKADLKNDRRVTY